MKIQLSWDLIQRRSAVCTQQEILREWVRGTNRLGKNSLPTLLVELSGGGLSGKVEVSGLAGGSHEHTMNSALASAKSAGHTMEEVAKHTKKGRCLGGSARTCARRAHFFSSTLAASWRFKLLQGWSST